MWIPWFVVWTLPVFYYELPFMGMYHFSNHGKLLVIWNVCCHKNTCSQIAQVVVYFGHSSCISRSERCNLIKLLVTTFNNSNNVLIMVIALSGVQFGLKSNTWLRAICNHKFDFRPKLHDTKCNFHFITFILKSTSGNVSLFTKYAPELAPSCNIATCEQNGRGIKSDDPRQ